MPRRKQFILQWRLNLLSLPSSLCISQSPVEYIANVYSKYRRVFVELASACDLVRQHTNKTIKNHLVEALLKKSQSFSENVSEIVCYLRTV